MNFSSEAPGLSPSPPRAGAGLAVGAAAPAGRGRSAAVAAALVGLCLLVFWQTGSHPFIDLDDAEAIGRTPFAARGLTREAVIQAFTSIHLSGWHPLTSLSHMLDVSLFGRDAGWHHRVNVLFHCLNAALLFRTLAGLTGAFWRSALVAALFAVHPLHVESVAWVAERKDVLSALFWFLTLGAYARYARRPGALRSGAVCLLYALGLLCKPMLVTLPLVLLLLDWWPLGRMAVGARGVGPAPAARPVWPLRRLIGEKAPLLLLSAVVAAVTYLAQESSGALASLEIFPLWVRIANVPVAAAWYLWKAVWPSRLAVFYPHPGAALPLWQAAAATAVLLTATVVAVRLRTRWPHALMGWLWYLGTLAPVVGLVQVGMQARADRYTYLPLLGIFLLVGWGAAEGPRAFGAAARGGVVALAVAALLALCGVSWNQVGYWRSNEALFTHALEVTAGNFVAHQALGVDLYRRGRAMEAVFHLGAALRIRPDNPLARYNLGVILEGWGKNEEAVVQYREALRLNPGYTAAAANMAVLLFRLGNAEEAVVLLRQAVRRDPLDPLAHNSLGYLLLNRGAHAEAAAHFREALRLQPDFAAAAANLRLALQALP